MARMGFGDFLIGSLGSLGAGLDTYSRGAAAAEEAALRKMRMLQESGYEMIPATPEDQAAMAGTGFFADPPQGLMNVGGQLVRMQRPAPMTAEDWQSFGGQGDAPEWFTRLRAGPKEKLAFAQHMMPKMIERQREKEGLERLVKLFGKDDSGQQYADVGMPVEPAMPAPAMPAMPATQTQPAPKGGIMFNPNVQRWIPMVTEAARRRNIDPRYLLAILATESSGDPSAKSGTSTSKGLMQTIDGTFQRFGKGDPFNPQHSIDAGAEYFGWLLDRYNGDYKKAVLAYNQGEGNVDRGTIGPKGIAYQAKVLSRMNQLPVDFFNEPPAGVQVASSDQTFTPAMPAQQAPAEPTMRAPSMVMQTPDAPATPAQMPAQDQLAIRKAEADMAKANQALLIPGLSDSAKAFVKQQYDDAKARHDRLMKPYEKLRELQVTEAHELGKVEKEAIIRKNIELSSLPQELEIRNKAEVSKQTKISDIMKDDDKLLSQQLFGENAPQLYSQLKPEQATAIAEKKRDNLAKISAAQGLEAQQQRPLEPSERQRLTELRRAHKVTQSLINDFTPEERKKYVGLLGLRGIYNDIDSFLKDLGKNKSSDPKYARFRALVAEAAREAFATGGKQLTPYESGIVFGYVPNGKEWSSEMFEQKLLEAPHRIADFITVDVELATTPRKDVPGIMNRQLGGGSGGGSANDKADAYLKDIP